jgi:hypothetical protein
MAPPAGSWGVHPGRRIQRSGYNSGVAPLKNVAVLSTGNDNPAVVAKGDTEVSASLLLDISYVPGGY